MLSIRRVILVAILLILAGLLIAPNFPPKTQDKIIKPQSTTTGYQDFLTIKILKKYVRDASDTTIYALEMTEYSQSIPIQPLGADIDHPWVLTNNPIIGSSMNYGNHAGKLIPFHGNWVVQWTVSGKISKDCKLLLHIDEFDIPGLEIGFLPALGIYDVDITEAGKGGEYWLVFDDGEYDFMMPIAGGVWNPEKSYMYVKVKWQRVPPFSMASDPKAWQPPCKWDQSMLSRFSEDRRNEIQPFAGK